MLIESARTRTVCLCVHLLLVVLSLLGLAWLSGHPELVLGRESLSRLPDNWTPPFALVLSSLAAVGLMSLAPLRPSFGLIVFVVIGNVFPRRDSYEFFCRWHVTEALALLSITGLIVSCMYAADRRAFEDLKFRFVFRHPLFLIMQCLMFWIVTSAAVANASGNYHPAHNHNPFQMLAADLWLIVAAFSLRSRNDWYWLGFAFGLTLCVRSYVAPQFIHLEGDMGVMQAIGIPLAILAFTVAGHWSLRLAILPILASQVFILLKTENRGGMLALAIAIVCGWCVCRWKWRLLLITTPLLFMLVPVFQQSNYWKRFEGIWGHGPDRGSVDSRLVVYAAGWNMTMHNPVFGVGLGNAETRMAEYSSVGKSDSPHNNIIGMLSETGIFGGLLYITLFAIAIGLSFWVALRDKVSDLHWIGVCLGASLVSYQISGLFMTRHTLEFAYLLLGGVIALHSALGAQIRSSAEGITIADDGSSETRTLVWFWLFAFIGFGMFVVLGSWYPFEVRTGDFRNAWEQWCTSIRTSPSKSDIAINLILGIPLGFFGFLAMTNPSPHRFAPSRGRRIWSVFAAGLVLFLVSLSALLVELGQHWFGGRVPSAHDTLSQIMGGLLGIAGAWLGGQWFACRMCEVFVQRSRAPVQALLDLYVVGYVLWMLMPFIPAVTPSELKGKWDSGMIQLSILAEWRTDIWQAIYTAAASAAIAAPVGLWFARRPNSASCGSLTLGAILGSVFTVCSLEIAQVFIETRSSNAADALWASIGVIAGVATWCNPFRKTTDRNTDLAQPAIVWQLLALLYALGYLAIALAPFDWIESSADVVERIKQLRVAMLDGMLAGNDMASASNLIRTICLSIPLGILLGTVAIGNRGQFRGIAFVALAMFTTIICLAAEFGQIFSERHSPSLLDAAARIGGGWFGLACSMRIRHWLSPYAPR